MKILFLVIGKTDEAYLEQGVEKYMARLRHYASVEMKVIPDIKNRKTLTEEQQKKAEGELIIGSLLGGDMLVLLDEKGKGHTSAQFAASLNKMMGSGCKRIVFVVGGPYGFDKAVYDRADDKLSLSPMTFSHQMVRLIFVEQLYRAFTILKGEPYHHE